MIELNGIESKSAEVETPSPRSQYIIFTDERIELKPGDEILLIVARPPDLKREAYAIALRITENAEADEDEFFVQYGEKLFVAQKLPEFI